MQKDFVFGKLGSNEAQLIVKNVVEKIRKFEGKVIFTKDTHQKDYLSTREGRFLPVEHCIENTPGWELIEEVDTIQKEKALPIYLKTTFGSMALMQALVEENQKTPIESIELIGVCTDICVVSNAILLKAALPEVEIEVDASCCAGVTPQKHKAALETLRSCQIVVKELHL